MGPARQPRNRLLAALDPREIARLGRHLELVQLPRDRTLHDPGATLATVFFPETALISVLTTMHDGQTAESASVGHEGMAGVDAVLGARTTAAHILVRVGGEGYALPAATIAAEARRSETVRDVLLPYAAAFIEQTAQSVACSRLHLLDQRAARWLLEAEDRLSRSEFPLTQESLASTLGVTRPAVSTVAAGFARDSIAEFRRGVVRIIDRDGLEERACECYEVIREAYVQLTGWDAAA